MNRLPPLSEMEGAFLRRDVAYDGLFVLGVRTTGVFCRPTCPARKPRVENVEYFPTTATALFAGYRPCKRCRPLEVDGQPAWAKTLIAELDTMPSLRITEFDLRRRGIDPTTARRHFQKHYGMTFQAYSRARRLGSALGQIRAGTSVADAGSANGYESPSGFRDAFARLLGDAPRRSRSRESVAISWIASPLGPLLAGATADGICLLEFTDRRMLEAQLAAVRRLFDLPLLPRKSELIGRLEAELARYFARTLRRFRVPLIYPGTPFQRRVWEELLEIPYGETRSYEEIAIAAGRPSAQRAVGHANGLNRIAIVIPCHRVVNKDGRLGGYGGGLRRKEFLLDLEQGIKRTPSSRRACGSPARGSGSAP